MKHALSIAGTYSINALKFPVGINWNSGKPITAPLSSNHVSNAFINYDSPNGSNLEDYLRLDLSATYDFTIGNNLDAFAGFSIWNLTDKSNMINTYYVVDDSNTISKIENRSLGLTPNFSFRIKF